MGSDAKDKWVAYVQALHQTVDALVAGVAAKNADRLQCQRGCAGCCVDGLSVFEVEAEVIRQAHPKLLAEGAPAPEGQCAFLSEDGACRIYEQRPYVCRTQGLPLRWLEESYEARDICPLNAEGEPLEELPEDACWTLGPVEERLAHAQRALDGGEGRRVPLRSLFRR